MAGDFSRFTFDAKKHYSAVHMQQGRVQLDADWNEQLSIEKHRLSKQMTDFIGYSGVPGGTPKLPETNPNFEITVVNNQINIGAGRIYIAGELYENEKGVDFTKQKDYPGAKLPTDTGSYIAYLDVWPREITALEDPDIREVALGGPDTTTRVKNLWQVKLAKKADQQFQPNWKPPGVEPISTGEMKARVKPNSNPTLENQLYRVEIHQGGTPSNTTIKWSRDNGAVAAKVNSINGKMIVISSAGRDPELGFSPGQWIELRSNKQILNGQPGTLYQLTQVQGNRLTVNGTPPQIGTKELWIVRRWDSPGAVPIMTTSNTIEEHWLPLENDIEVAFEGTDTLQYKTGDYWLFPSRYLTGKIEWPTDSSGAASFERAHGIHHHYAPLAELSVVASDSTWTWSKPKDLRNKFSSLIGGFLSTTGGTMTGPLTINSNLTVTGVTKIGPEGTLYPVASQENLQVIIGSVNADGTSPQAKGFTSEKVSIGERSGYKITITGAQNSEIKFLVQTASNTLTEQGCLPVSNIVNVVNNVITLAFYNIKNEQFIESKFCFTAIISS